MSADDPTPHLERYATYEEACREFRKTVPPHFNIAEAICRRHGDPVTRTGLIEVRPAANNTYTVGALDYFSDKFATVLAGSGIVHGDAMAVMLPQSAALAVAHLGALKLGAVVVPLSSDASPEQIELIFKHTAARALIVDDANRGDPALRGGSSIDEIFVVSDAIHDHIVKDGDRSFWREVYEAASNFRIVENDATAPAFVFLADDGFGGLGGSRCVAHSHAALIDSFAAFEMVNNLEPAHDAILWTPDAWASIETLFGMVYPALYYGVPIVAGGPMNFDGDRALELMQDCEVTTAILTTAQLRAWKTSHPDPRERFDLKLQRVIVTDSGTTRETIDWVRTELDASLQSDLIIAGTGPLAATCERWFDVKPGTAGRAVPGRTVEILDNEGAIVPRGSPGRIAVRLADDSVGGEYIDGSREARGASTFDWFITGQVGIKDEDGNLTVCS